MEGAVAELGSVTGVCVEDFVAVTFVGGGAVSVGEAVVGEFDAADGVAC